MTATTSGVRPNSAPLIARRNDLVEDAQWLVDTGECWSQAVIRLGYPGHPDSLERRLYRAGRTDLINTLRSREITNPDRPYDTHPHTRATNGRTQP